MRLVVKIVTGSLNGVLRMYSPTHNEFKIEHLLLEENLHHPILQIEMGYFIPYVLLAGLISSVRLTGSNFARLAILKATSTCSRSRSCILDD